MRRDQIDKIDGMLNSVPPPPNSPACNAAVTTSLRLTWRSFRRVGSYEGRSRYLAAVVHRHGSRHANRDNGDRASGLGHRQDHGDCLPTIAHPHSPYLGSCTTRHHRVPPPRAAPRTRRALGRALAPPTHAQHAHVDGTIVESWSFIQSIDPPTTTSPSTTTGVLHPKWLNTLRRFFRFCHSIFIAQRHSPRIKHKSCFTRRCIAVHCIGCFDNIKSTV